MRLDLYPVWTFRLNIHLKLNFLNFAVYFYQSDNTVLQYQLY